MTREEVLKELLELPCFNQNIRMTDCLHCLGEIESLVRELTEPGEKEERMIGGNLSVPDTGVTMLIWDYWLKLN